MRLLHCQGRCKELEPLIASATRLLRATSKDSVVEDQKISQGYRLNPVDGVLEREVQTQKVAIWVPVFPNVALPGIKEKGKTWRRWAFEKCHLTMMNPHRPPGPTWQTIKRVAYWPGMYKDVETWLHNCAVCHQYRTVGHMAPMRSTLASLPHCRLPWSDVIIDCQGPFTRSAEGMSYVLSYHCTLLGVCKLQPFKRLTKDCFLQALVACIMRARRIPEIVRSDRGPEMTSAVMEEFLTIGNARQSWELRSRRGTKARVSGSVL